MLAVIDIKAELDKLAQRPVSSAAPRRTSFSKLASSRDGGLFRARLFGETPWECHPSGDELVHIIEGTATFHIITAGGAEPFKINAGTIVVVPHRKVNGIASNQPTG
jgi:uncharacterized cupin superfamily protein